MGPPAPGAGPDRHKACAPAFVQRGGLTIGIVSADATLSAFAATEDAPGTCHVSSDDLTGAMDVLGPSIVTARENADVVQLSYSKLRDISDALRMGSRKSSGIIPGVNLNEVVEQSMVLAAGRIRVFDPEVILGELPEIACQPNYLGQVIINLFTNAADAMQEHCESKELKLGDQSIRLETRSETFDGKEGVRLTLEDSGPGVPQSIREKIFESFFTTKPHGVGTGLGLAISVKIIKDHHGVIEVGESSTLGGARFSLWLPISQPIGPES